MKKVLLQLALLLDGLVVGLMIGLLMSTEQRLRLSQQVAGAIGGVAEQMPEGWPWKDIMSGVLQTLEQNIQDLERLQEQAPIKEA